MDHLAAELVDLTPVSARDPRQVQLCDEVACLIRERTAPVADVAIARRTGA